MADYDLVQVSELEATETPANADVLPIQQGTTLKKITYANLKSNVVSDEANARQNADALKLNKPTGGNGTSGQMLLTNGDGSTQWASPDATLATTGKAADAKATGDAIKAVDANLAAPYSTSATYAVGDYCTKDGVLKRCNTAITTAEAWNSAHWDDAKLGGDVSTLRSAFNDLVADKYELVKPTNWLNLDAITDGELNKDGTISASTTRFYTDFIPVTVDSVIQCFRGDTLATVYRRHICCFDGNKTVIPSAGSDNSNEGTYTISLLSDPEAVKFIRVTLDKNILSLLPMITLDGVPTTYSVYFNPYVEIAEDFLVPESETAIQKIINKTLSTLDLKNAYACALPKGYIFRQTVGLPEKWYYSNAVSPLTPVSIGVGQQYGQKEDDGISFPNNTALSSSNGYGWNVYDVLLNLINTYGQNVPYGADRHIVAENLSNCSCLVIGDSTVDHDTMTQKMLDYFTSKGKTLTLLGTLGSGTNRNEGRAGWKATDYLTDKVYEGVTNPFYNDGSFDFSYYMTQQGYSAPDFVVIQLGINDLYNYTVAEIVPTWEAIKTMIDSIIAYNSGIHIILNLPTAPNSDQSKHTVLLPLYQNRVVRYNEYAMRQAYLLYGQSKVRPSYCHLILDPSTEINDNVHPNASGYEKMAKEVINQINCWQNGA